MNNQNPKQIERDCIDSKLTASGWVIQNSNRINLSANIGVAVREYRTDTGPADYVLFLHGKPVGIIEAKRKEEGYRFSVHEQQVERYANAKLQYISNRNRKSVIGVR